MVSLRRLFPDSSAGGRWLWAVDELFDFQGALHLRGWAFGLDAPIRSLALVTPTGESQVLQAFTLSSDDVLQAHGGRARDCRFRSRHELPGGVESLEGIRLRAEFSDGRHAEIALADAPRPPNPYQALMHRFFEQHLARRPAGRVLELGARARSGIQRKSLVPAHHVHVGMDVMAGPGVDVVGDAHRLSELVPTGAFTAAFSVSVFEHLAMPWKVALELNRVLEPGGLVLVATHQTWPLHDAPWDYWRFSDQAWRALFNRATGFRILETALGSPASVVAHWREPPTVGLDRQPAYLASIVLAEKTGETTLRWDVDAAELVDAQYPH
jgi:hypothetical protein